MLTIYRNPLPAILACTLAVAGANSAAQAADAADPNVVAVINGRPLTQPEFYMFVKVRLGKDHDPSELNQRELGALLGEFINRELIFQDAIEHGVDTAPEVVLAIQNHRRNIIASYRLRQIISGAPPSDAALKKAYLEHLAKPTREYLVRHILVQTEREAREIVAALDQGADFGQLARDKSLDSSNQKGGELGWYAPEQVIKPLRDALEQLEPGTYTKAPIDTSFGWHVLLLDKIRIIPPPPFDSVKDKLRARLQNETVAKHIAELRDKSEISVK